MATPQISREELEKELIKIRASYVVLLENDIRRRKEFAKAFKWTKNIQYLGMSHIEHEPQLPSWEEIFVQTGKLLVLEELKQKIIPTINIS